MVFKTYTKIANIGAFAVFFAFALFINSNILLSQELIWAKKAGSIGIDKAQDIKVDGNGNSYITGNIYGNGVYFSIFGEGETNETQLKAAYLEDVFVAKYDNAGAVVWAKAGTGMGRNYGEYIEIDNSGNSYVIGRFQSSITFGEGESNETTLTSQGGWDVFVAKFGTNGELHWVVPIQSSNNVLTGGIAADNSGNIYVTGNFSTETYFDENTSLTPNASTDVFLAKYNNDGELVWVKQYGNLGTLAKFAIEVTDNIYLSGRFINNLTIDTITLTAAGSRKFIAKLDLDANAIWARAYGSSVTGVDVERIAVDNLDNIVTTGRFIGTISIGSEEISSPGNYDIFVLKFNSSGDVLWARTAGGNGFDAAEGLSVDAHNNIYISGFIRETAIFGANEANETTVTSNGDSDIFFAMLYPDGNLSWVIAAGSNSLEIGTSVGTDSFGNVYGTGFFKNSMIFGEGEVNETELFTYGNFGYDDVFIAKFASSWDVVSACPLNFAYWKQNENEFPASVLPMTLGTTNSYNARQLTNLLNAPVGGDASILLARQLISAKLNIANGAPVPDGLLDLLAEADNAIGTGSLPMNVKPNTALGKTMQNLANSIAKYNNNELTPDCEIPENSIYQEEDYLSGFEYEGVTSVDEFTISGFGLSQNFPNPANNSTSIQFTLPVSSDVSIDIFNVLGEKIMTVLQSNSFEAGTHTINFSTELLQSGSYFYRMTAAQKSHTRIMQIIR